MEIQISWGLSLLQELLSSHAKLLQVLGGELQTASLNMITKHFGGPFKFTEPLTMHDRGDALLCLTRKVKWVYHKLGTHSFAWHERWGRSPFEESKSPTEFGWPKVELRKGEPSLADPKGESSLADPKVELRKGESSLADPKGETSLPESKVGDAVLKGEMSFGNRKGKA